MGVRQLYFQIKWLQMEYRDKTHFARPLEKLIGFTQLEKYDADEIENELSKAVSELYTRDKQLAAKFEAERAVKRE